MKKEIDIDLSADELAEMFVGWDDIKQADFINKVGEHFKQSNFDAELQCCFMSNHIKKLGKDFIYTMTNFLKVQKFTHKSKHYDMLINSCDHDTLR
jgi:hypothetical protein